MLTLGTLFQNALAAEHQHRAECEESEKKTAASVMAMTSLRCPRTAAPTTMATIILP